MTKTIKSVPKRITLPGDWEAAIEEHCQQHGLNFSEYVTGKAIEGLPASVRKNLSTRRPARRPRKDEL